MRRNLVYGFRYDHQMSANADSCENAVENSEFSMPHCRTGFETNCNRHLSAEDFL